jgi:hypothetical protein
MNEVSDPVQDATDIFKLLVAAAAIKRRTREYRTDAAWPALELEFKEAQVRLKIQARQDATITERARARVAEQRLKRIAELLGEPE